MSATVAPDTTGSGAALPEPSRETRDSGAPSGAQLLPANQFGLYSLADELRSLARPHQRVNALKNRLWKPNGRADDSKRGSAHAPRGIRYRFVRQGLHYFRYRLLTDNRHRFYITAIG